MGVGQIVLIFIALALMGGVAYWATRPTTTAAPEGQAGTPAQNEARRNAVLAGSAAPPRNDDPRRDTSGRCLAPWHSVTQWDLSSHCDLPGGFEVVVTGKTADGKDIWHVQEPDTTHIGAEISGAPLPEYVRGSGTPGVVTVVGR